MKRTAIDYTKQNREAASIVLASPEQFGVGMVRWAGMVMGTTEQKPRQTGEQLTLGFGQSEVEARQ